MILTLCLLLCLNSFRSLMMLSWLLLIVDIIVWRRRLQRVSSSLVWHGWCEYCTVRQWNNYCCCFVFFGCFFPRVLVFCCKKNMEANVWGSIGDLWIIPTPHFTLQWQRGWQKKNDQSCVWEPRSNCILFIVFDYFVVRLQRWWHINKLTRWRQSKSPSIWRQPPDQVQQCRRL